MDKTKTFYSLNIDQLIEELQQIREKYGNINVRVQDECGFSVNVGSMYVWKK